MAKIRHAVGLLATGDELTLGDVLETNNFYMAERLQSHDINVGMHLIASDEQANIEAGISFLLENHDVLIVSGGLGPTSDDRTRFALAAVLKEDLVFDEGCWQQIKNRLEKLALPIPENNRLQCLFPKNATIFPNANGTAAACRVTKEEKQIFILPGPPFECYPIFESEILPFLVNNNYTQPLFRQQWLLLNVSEGSLANQLDPLVINSGCEIGYRVNFPYLELKLRSQNKPLLQTLAEKFSPIIDPFIVSTRKQKASSQLIEYIVNQHCHINIIDEATGGLLSTTLLNLETFPYLHFNENPTSKEAIQVSVKGLAEYWQKQENSNPLTISIQLDNQTRHFQQKIPFRKERTLLYAVEVSCWVILKAFLLLKSNESEPQ